MEPEIFSTRLSSACRKALGEQSEIADLQRLSGGANMESWAFAYGGARYVLRRMPDGLSESETSDPSIAQALSLAQQARLITAAQSSGITAPPVIFSLSAHDNLGEGFVMAHIAGETLPQRILNKPEFAQARDALMPQCAQELAKIHAMTPDPDWGLESALPAEALAQLKARSFAANCRSDIFTFAFGWLTANAPPETSPHLLHGDFRMGNLIVNEQGLAAVLDWELAHLGDPVQDLAYFCTPSWRFGHYAREAGGLDSAEAWIAAYQQASGTSINAKRFTWWLVYNTLWWGVVCASMAQMWRDGSDRTLERAVIGRRVSEVEVDLILLLEEAMNAPQSVLSRSDVKHLHASMEAPGAGTRDDEALKALTDWLSQQPAPDDKHARFEHKVALNALAMAERSARLRQCYTDWQTRRLTAMGSSYATYDIYRDFDMLDDDDPRLWRHWRLTAMENCLIDQPDYAGLKTAQTQWMPS